MTSILNTTEPCFTQRLDQSPITCSPKRLGEMASSGLKDGLRARLQFWMCNFRRERQSRSFLHVSQRAALLALFTMGSAAWALTPTQQQAHINWMLLRVNASQLSCGPAGSAAMTCARSILPMDTVKSAWDGNVNLTGLTIHPASSSAGQWSQSAEGHAVRAFAHADGTFYVLTLIGVTGGTELILGYVNPPSSGNVSALSTTSRLALMITPAAAPTYRSPLKPPAFRTAEMDGLRGKVASVTTRSFEIDSQGKSTLARTEIFSYDAAGRLWKTTHQDGTGKVTSQREYIFEGALLKREVSTNSAGVFSTAFAYDDRGNWREERAFGADRQLQRLVTVTAFPNGYESADYDSDGRVSARRRVLLSRFGEEVAFESHQNKVGDMQRVFTNDRLVRIIFGTEQSELMMVAEYDPVTGEHLKTTASTRGVRTWDTTDTCIARDAQSNCTTIVEHQTTFGTTVVTRSSGRVERVIQYHKAP